MGFINGLFNGSKGANWEAGNRAIQMPTTNEQAQTAYDQTQQGLSQQAAFLQALQGVNGIQNQQGVFNQMQNVANGTGPNPAQAMLNQATGQNVANTAAAMASQRGAGANVGLLGRQAAQMGANTQQNAVGQAATLQANQSLNALNNMGNIAGQQVQNQGNAANAYSQAAQGQQANLLNSIGQQNNANVAMQSNINNTNANLAGINAQAQNKLVGGAINGIGGAVSSLLNKGGIVKMAYGGVAAPPEMATEPMKPVPAMQDDTNSGTKEAVKAGIGLGMAHGGNVNPNAPKSRVGRHLSGHSPEPKAAVPALLSPGEKYLSPAEAQAVNKGKASPQQVGKVIPGQAKVKGDSPKNDTVPAKLQEGGVVIPRSVMQSPNPMAATIAFVHAHLNQQKSKKKKA